MLGRVEVSSTESAKFSKIVPVPSYAKEIFHA